MSQLVYQYTEAEGCANDTQPKKPVHLYLWGQNQNCWSQWKDSRDLLYQAEDTTMTWIKDKKQ